MSRNKNLVFSFSIILSVLITIYSFLGSSIKVRKNTDNTISVIKHGKEFIVKNDPGKLSFYDGDKKIREISISEKFDIKEYNINSAVYSNNCAIVAAATAGIGVAAFLAGSGAFLQTFGIATTEIEGWFALAASGASVAEVTAAVKGTCVFWGLAGALVGGVVL